MGSERERDSEDFVSSYSTSMGPSTTFTQSPSQDVRPRNRRPSWPRHSPKLPTYALFFIFLTCCFSFASASAYIEEQMVEVVDVAVTSELLKSSLARLARTGTILVDQRPEPDPKAWVLATENDDLQHRDNNNNNNIQRRTEPSSSFSSTSATKSSTKTSSVPSSTKSSTSTKTSSGLVVATEETSTITLPKPFDQGFNGNITDSCSNFMSGILTNSTFNSCLPFSLILKNSNSFFEITKSLFKTTQTLDTTCSADLLTCAPLMASLASNISSASNCGSDLSNQNPLIQDALLGLKAYKPLYSASCLRNPQTSSYCFADAVTNASSPTDSYIYYLPLNISLPGGSQPTCNSCLKSAMAIFSAASSDRSSAIASTYLDAAEQINFQCGPSYVNATLAAEITNSSPATLTTSNIGLLALALLVGSWLS